LKALYFILIYLIAVSPYASAEREIEIIQGDIAVFKKSPFDKAAPNPYRKKWKNGIIPYGIYSKSRANNRMISAVNNAISYLSKKTNLRFVKRTNERDFVSFSDQNKGCYSFVGKAGGRQFINLSSGCWYTMTVVHEIFHAVGIEHEQCRSDRDSNIKIIWNNIKEDNKHNFHKINNSNFSSYNIKSIMHYGSYSFSKNKKPTMTTKNGKIFYQNRSALTKEDIAGINYIYPQSKHFNLNKVFVNIKKYANEFKISMSTGSANEGQVDHLEYSFDGGKYKKLEGWKFYLPLETAKKGLAIKFYLNNGKVIEKNWTIFLLANDPKITCKIWAKREFASFNVPLSFNKKNLSYGDQEYKGRLGKVSALYNFDDNSVTISSELSNRKGALSKGRSIKKTKKFTKSGGMSSFIDIKKKTKITCRVDFNN